MKPLSAISGQQNAELLPDNLRAFGLRWQSAAATTLSRLAKRSGHAPHRFAGSQSGVALHFPPHSKRRCAQP